MSLINNQVQGQINFDASNYENSPGNTDYLMNFLENSENTIIDNSIYKDYIKSYDEDSYDFGNYYDESSVSPSSTVSTEITTEKYNYDYEHDYYDTYLSNFGADGGDKNNANNEAYYYDYYNPNIDDLYQDDSNTNATQLTQRKISVIGLNHNLPRNKQYWSKTQLKNKKKIIYLNRLKTSPIGLLSSYKMTVSKMRVGLAPLTKRFTDYGCWCFQTGEDEIPGDVPAVDDYDKLGYGG